MTYNIKKKRNTNKDIDYNPFRQFRPLSTSVIALSIKSDFLALRSVVMTS